ncbi:DUF6894 family protein [Sphingomonas bacterium]|uniref:DUF6894 family protein n=1 Tax=Sphingomonas bacterium TaxID=1895847 RepID=UPI001576DF90|nr:hypothetical protein [Sphingomonas bacterium]
MTRYYFDLHECGRGSVIDDEGAELESLEAARHHAIAAARGIMAEEVGSGNLCLGCAITIRDGDGVALMAVPFAEALSITFVDGC